MAALTILGTLIGLGLGLLIELVADLTSFPGIFGRGSYLGEPVLLLVFGGIGLLFGIGAGAAVIGETLRIHVSAKEIILKWGDARVRVRADIITDIALGANFVIYAAGGVELARVNPSGIDPDKLTDALLSHGYPKPSHREIGLFTPDLETVPQSARRVIIRREEALRAGNVEIAELLRRQLVGMGIMVRDIGSGRRTRTEVRTIELQPAL